MPAPQGTWTDPRVQAQTLVDEVRDEVVAAYPGMTVDTHVHAGTGAYALVTQSAEATTALVAVGARGRGGFAGLAIGSVATQTAIHAKAPVLVVRDAGDDQVAVDAQPSGAAARASTSVHRGPTIVGVDGSRHAEHALQLAFEEAGLRQVPLVVVNVWSPAPENTLRPDDPNHWYVTGGQERAERMLADLVSFWSEKYSDVSVERRALKSLSPSFELIQAGQSASLVVVGSRGRGGFAGLLLGSVSRDLVDHCPTSVLVVHSRPTR